jgi:hypothetical protein
MSSNTKKLVYITREIERALGMNPSSDFLIVTNDTQYGNEIKKSFPEGIALLKGDDSKLLGTGELLSHPELKNIIQDPALCDLIVFKNTPRVEQSARLAGWKLLNPRAGLSEQVENKISQIDWLGPLENSYLPRHRISKARNIIWNNRPVIIQWAHGHTGSGTVLINQESELNSLKEKFPERLSRVTEYIEGSSYTVNVVVASNKVLMSSPSYQITGIQPFTDNQFSTVGNDWSFANSSLTQEDKSAIEEMALNIGKKLNIGGWRGLFGIDIIKSSQNGRIYLIEINARQPASTTYESQLQIKRRNKGIKGVTTFEAHISALRGENIDTELIPVTNGAQIVQRITEKTKNISTEKVKNISEMGYETISYGNSEIGADLIRIQSDSSFISSHGNLNDAGSKIAYTLSS